MTNIAYYKSPFGPMQVKYTDNALIYLKHAHDQKNIPPVHDTPAIIKNAFEQLDAYFAGKLKFFDFNYEMHGTDFQKKVWAALCDIPYGETCSYADIANAIGNPKACRAVGLANNKNPMSIVVPCHRVIGKNGKLVGYAGGLDMKQALLAMEAGKLSL